MQDNCSTHRLVVYVHLKYILMRRNTDHGIDAEASCFHTPIERTLAEQT